MANNILVERLKEIESASPIVRTLEILEKQKREHEREKCFFNDYEIRKKPINKISYL